MDYLRNHYSLCKDKLYEYRIQDVELEFQIQREKPGRSCFRVNHFINIIDRAMLYFTGMDAERAAHFVKELRNLEMDILKLNERIDRLQ